MRPFLALLALLAAGCDSDGIGGLSEFGDPYSLDLSDSVRPALFVSDDVLSVPVTYGGGCAEHDFALRSRVAGDSATVWLAHDANGDLCLALVGNVVEVRLPRGSATAQRIVLRAPTSFEGDDETTIRLR